MVILTSTLVKSNLIKYPKIYIRTLYTLAFIATLQQASIIHNLTLRTKITIITRRGGSKPPRISGPPKLSRPPRRGGASSENPPYNKSRTSTLPTQTTPNNSTDNSLKPVAFDTTVQPSIKDTYLQNQTHVPKRVYSIPSEKHSPRRGVYDMYKAREARLAAMSKDAKVMPPPINNTATATPTPINLDGVLANNDADPVPDSSVPLIGSGFNSGFDVGAIIASATTASATTAIITAATSTTTTTTVAIPAVTANVISTTPTPFTPSPSLLTSPISLDSVLVNNDAPPLPAKPIPHTVPTQPITPAMLNNVKQALKPITPTVLNNTKQALKPPDPTSTQPKALSDIQLYQNNMKLDPPFKSISDQVPYIPVISQATNSNDFTRDQIIDFLLERGLLKKGEHNNEIKILIKPSGVYVLGVKMHNNKLTQYGNAYHQKVTNHKSSSIPSENVPNNIDPSKDADIIIVKPSGLDNVVYTGAMKHLLHAYQSGDYYYVSGSYTSKNTNEPLSKTQYGDYQKQKESNKSDAEIIPGKKIQYFLPQDQLQKIHKDQVLVTKWGRDYLNFIKQQEMFRDIFTDQENKVCIPLNSTGVTKDHAHTMCQDFDYTCAKSQKHPPTLNDDIYQEKLKKPTNVNKQSKHDLP